MWLFISGWRGIMSVHWNKRWSLAALSLLALTAQWLHADDTALGLASELPMAVADAAPSNEKTTAQGMSDYRVFDPFSVKNSCDLWVEGDVLLWLSGEDSLGYAVKSDSTTSISHGHVEEPDFDWDWGVRLGLGYKLPYDKWDIFINYTYVHAHADGSASKSDGAIFPQWQAPFGLGSPVYATHAKADWNANVNIGDIELGRDCFVAKWLSIRPFIGIRGLVINQDYDVQYRGGTSVPAGDRDKVSLDTDFWGVGLRMGFDSLWAVGAGWSIYGNGAASLLSGHFDIHQQERLREADLRRVGLSNDVDNVVVAAELALGIRVGLPFFERSLPLWSEVRMGI